jgi:PhoH-like ATPase
MIESKNPNWSFDQSVTNLEGDDGILETLKLLGKRTTLLTNDRNLRIRAASQGSNILKYEFAQINIQHHDSVYLSEESFEFFEKTGVAIVPEGIELLPWEVIRLTCDNVSQSRLAYFNPVKNKIVKPVFNETIWNISPRSEEQKLALEFLLNPDIKMVTLTGAAGCGKTLLALTAAMKLVVDEQKLEKIVVTRPVIPLGSQDIGFLPGSLEEKMESWMQPIYDNLGIICETKSAKKGKKQTTKLANHEEIAEMGLVEVVALSFIRGRSLHNQFLIVDEAQNLSLLELKTILSRAGENTKIILTGDTDQIDIGSKKSGLSKAIRAFLDSKLAAHISLQHSERSELAAEAAERL